MTSSTMTGRWKFLIIITASVLLVYGQTLKFGFVNYDDDELIYKNEKFLSDWRNVGTAFTAHAFIGAGGESVYYRPLHVVTLIIDYHIWQLDPFGYHLSSVVLHTMTVILVFLLFEIIFGNSVLALFGSLIFALHPVQTESVGWIAGRNDILLGFFITLMTISHVQSLRNTKRIKLYRILTSISFTFAILTKESAVFFLLLLPIYELCFHNKTLRETISKKNILRFLPMMAILALYFIIRLNIFSAFIGAEQMYGKGKPFLDRLANIPGIVAEHLQLLIAPLSLSVAHQLSDIIWLKQPWYFVSFIVLLLFTITLWRSWRKHPVLFFGLAWLAVGLLPALNLFPMPKPILEHRLYVPMTGVALAISFGIDRFSNIIQTVKFREVLFSVLTITLAILSYLRLPVWENGVTLFTDAVKKAPTDLHSNYSLARAQYDIGNYSECKQILNYYLTLAPTDPRGYRFLREVYYVSGRRKEVAEICKKMIELQPYNPLRYLETGVIYEELGQPDTAAIYYRQGIGTDSSVAQLHFRLGIVSERLGQPSIAAKSYKRAIVLNVQDADAYFYLAKIYASVNDLRSAIQVLESGLSIKTPSIDYLTLLLDLYDKSGDETKAVELKRRLNF